MLLLSSILLRLSWNTRNIFEDLGPLRDSIRDVIVSDDVDIGCMIVRLTASYVTDAINESGMDSHTS